MTWQAYQEFMQAMQVRIAEKSAQGLQSGRGVEVNDRVITLDPVIRAAPAVGPPVIRKVLFADITVTQSEGQIKLNTVNYEPFEGDISYGLREVVRWVEPSELDGYEINVGTGVDKLVYSGDYSAGGSSISDQLWISPLTRKARIRFYVRGFIEGFTGDNFEDGMNVGGFRVSLLQRGQIVVGNEFREVTEEHLINVGWQGDDLSILSIAERDTSQGLFVTGVANS
jgi:hypothetical protein